MRFILIIIFLFLTNYIFSQNSYELGEIFHRDGTSEKGYLKIKYSVIKYKNKITKKKHVELTYKEVEKIIINEDGKEYEYQYKIIKGRKKGKFKLLKLVISGKASLYQVEHETNISTSGAGTISNGITYKGADYYIGKNASSFVEFIGANSIAVGRKSIRKGLITYFKDCKELVKKLKIKEFKNKNIVNSVQFYNNNCFNN